MIRRRVVGDEDDLGVAGLAGADLAVVGVRGEATGVAGRRRHDAGRLPEVLLGAPEAAEPEDRGLRPVGPGTLERRAVHEMAVGEGHRRLAAREGGVGGGHGRRAEEELHGLILRAPVRIAMTLR